MKRSCAAVAMVGALACAMPALANPVSVGDHLRFSAGPGSANGPMLGGELAVNVLQSGQAFRTFCLEVEEHIFFGGAPDGSHPFEVDNITNTAILGGTDFDSPGDGGDQISSRTAYLYQNFWYGTLTGYTFGGDFDPDRIRSADALQNAIWYLEHEISDPFSGITDAATQALITQFLTMDMGGWTGLGDVQVLNLTYRWTGLGGEAGGHAQDVLIVTIPLPQTFGLGMAGLMGVIGVSAFRRRR